VTRRVPFGRSGMPAHSPHLTPREKQTLALTQAGFSIPEIADRLRVAERTAKHYSDSLRRKYGVRHRRELIRVPRAA
jgi:DNA-binding CsgD family transcriptional regulator